MTIETLQQKATRLNTVLEGLPTAQDRLRCVLEELGQSEKIALTTSMGMQSALMLHLVTNASKETTGGASSVPVVWIDTGYLPKETYEFAARVTHYLDLDLRVYQSAMTPARMEAMHGKLWEDESNEAHKKYNFIRKVEPMKRALKELEATVVLSGVRAGQTSHRRAMKMVHVHDGRLKICPVLDWTDEQVHALFEQEGLPYHPLREQGYVSVGDWHSSAPFDPTIHKDERDTRFHGRTQECGLHLSDPEPKDDKQGMMLSASTSSIVTSITTSGDSNGFLLYTKPNCRFCKAAKALLQHLRNDEQMNHQLSNKGKDKDAPKMASTEDDDSTASMSVTSSTASNFEVTDEVTVGKDISPSEIGRTLGRTIKTVPQILYKGNYIGGYEDLVKFVGDSFPSANLPDTVQLAEKFRQQ